MPCKCGSTRVASINAKSSDCNNISLENSGREHQGYVPRGLGIGSGDYVEFDWCLQCGLIQGMKFPLPEHDLEAEKETEE
jgi:hypothetical protein